MADANNRMMYALTCPHCGESNSFDIRHHFFQTQHRYLELDGTEVTFNDTCCPVTLVGCPDCDEDVDVQLQAVATVPDPEDDALHKPLAGCPPKLTLVKG